MHHPTERIAHTTFVTPVVEHWLEQEIAHEDQYLDNKDLSKAVELYIPTHKNMLIKDAVLYICYAFVTPVVEHWLE